MESNAFWTELHERVAKYDLLCHPYYKSWSAGSLTRADLREYAANYYHHVAAFPTYLAAFYARLEDGAFRRAVLANLADEEAIEGGRPHSEIWLDFAEGMGADRDAARASQAIPEIQALISAFPPRRSERLAGRSARRVLRLRVPSSARRQRKSSRTATDVWRRSQDHWLLHAAYHR